MFLLIPWKIDTTGVQNKRVPAANIGLIAANLLLFLVGAYWPVDHSSSPLSVVLYGFSHAGLWHLVVNMWALVVFGNPVNRRLGNGPYLAVYLGTILALGLVARFVIPQPVVGSSGAVFAVIGIAMILLPRGLLTLYLLALLPLTFIIGLFARPKRSMEWLVRWETRRLPMIWALVMVPLLFAWELAWLGWNWSTGAHLMGMACGAMAVALLPTRITMPAHSLAGASYDFPSTK